MLEATIFRLTPTEEIIYAVIMEANGETVTVDDFRDALGWGLPTPADSQLVRSHLCNLRRKLPAAEADRIVTEYGWGWYYDVGTPRKHRGLRAKMTGLFDAAPGAFAWVEAQRSR